jgi:excisionase family DNA binding protein
MEKLLVSPEECFEMLGIGVSRGYALLKAGEIESFRDGNRRKVKVSSIHQYIERHSEPHFQVIRDTPRPSPLIVPAKRGRGRPRKDQT